MNFLFHMLLSGSDDQILVGNFMGDYVKGPLEGRFHPRIRCGIVLHRRIDSFAEQHPFFRQSKYRISKEYGLYRGIMVDLFYDYYLVNDWSVWCHEPLSDYLARTRLVIEKHRDSIPEEMHRLIPMLFDELLPSYGTVEGIGSALYRLSRRIKRSNPLGGGEQELVRHHAGLHDDFKRFIEDVSGFAAKLIDSNRCADELLKLH